MRNVRLEEQKRLEKERDGKNEAHQGQAGQILTSKDRRRAEREKTKADVKAEDRVKRMKHQADKEKNEQAVKKGRATTAQKNVKATA
jgi:small subunit ribosomal protein S17